MDYLKYINEYGNSLNDSEKIVARRLFENLMKKGWSFERIFHGIRLLKERPISRYKGLFYFQDFLEEIDKEIDFAHGLIDAPYEKKVLDFNRLYQFGYDQIPDELKKRCDILDKKLCGIDEDEIREFTQEELKEEVDYLYEKCIVEPQLLLPLSELEDNDTKARRQYNIYKRGC